MNDYKLSVDYIMIIGKYFKSNNDFINLIKVNSKFKNLNKMYFFNPISDCSMFKNIQTQHFYKYEDIFYRNRNMYQYVYWIEEYLIKEYLNLIDSSKCIVKNVVINKLLKYLYDMDYLECKWELILNNSNKPIELLKSLKNLQSFILLFKYGKNFIGFRILENPNTFPKEFKSDYFVNYKEYKSCCSIFISEKFNKISIRKENFNVLFYITIDEFYNNITLEVIDNYYTSKLGCLLYITDWCLIKIDS